MKLLVILLVLIGIIVFQYRPFNQWFKPDKYTIDVDFKPALGKDGKKLSGMYIVPNKQTNGSFPIADFIDGHPVFLLGYTTAHKEITDFIKLERKE